MTNQATDMTDRTHPEAGSTHIIRYALELGLLWIDGDGRDKVREALAALDALEAKLAYIGTGGVQALSAAPAVPNGDELRRIARSARTSASDDASPTEYVLAGWKAAMLAASPTPPAEQQAAPKAAPREPVNGWPVEATIYKRRDEWVLELSGTINDCAFTCRHTQPGYLQPEDVAGLPSLYSEGIAPQQEAQEPVGKYLTVVYRDLTRDEAQALIDHEKMSAASWSHALHERDMAKAAPQPAPAPLSDAQIKELIEDGVFLGNCKEIVRAIEHAHGITQKGGSNAE